MKVVEVGYNYNHPEGMLVKRDNGLKEHLLLIVKTSAVFLLQNKLVEIPGNSAVIYSAGTPQLYGNRDKEYVDDWILFSINGEEEDWFKELGIPTNTAIPLGDSTVFSHFIREIGYEINSKNTHKEISTELYLKLLIIKLSEKIKSSKLFQVTSPHYNKLLELKSQIQNNPEKNWNIDDIAKKLFLSPSHFQHLYKELFGISVMSDIIQSRIERAQYLLYSTSEPISKISEMLGYRSTVHFVRQFKDLTGTTPSKYRKQQGLSEQPYIYSYNTTSSPNFDPKNNLIPEII